MHTHHAVLQADSSTDWSLELFTTIFTTPTFSSLDADFNVSELSIHSHRAKAMIFSSSTWMIPVMFLRTNFWMNRCRLHSLWMGPKPPEIRVLHNSATPNNLHQPEKSEFLRTWNSYNVLTNIQVKILNKFLYPQTCCVQDLVSLRL